MLQLSEHLYPIDEVIQTFIQCIITRGSIDETLFWLWEIDASCSNVVYGIIYIYCQFYSIENNYLDKYISNKINQYNSNGDLKHLAAIVCALRILNPNIDCYLIYSSLFNENSKINKIYKKKDIQSIANPQFNGLLRSIYYKSHNNIGVYLSILFKQYTCEEILTELYKFIETTYNLSEKDIIINIGDDFKNEDIYVCSIISRIMNIENFIKEKTRRLYPVAPVNITTNLHNLFYNHNIEHGWKVLKHTRLYSTHSILGLPIGTKIYGRFEVNDFQKACREHWDYYCFNSRLWKSRFEKYNCNQLNDTCIVSYNDEDNLHAFGENGFDMEFDEQSLEVQNKSLHSIEIISDEKVWFDKMIEERNLNYFANLNI